MRIKITSDVADIEAEVLNLWDRDTTARLYRNTVGGGTAFTCLQGACSLFDIQPKITRVMLVSNFRMKDHKAAGAVFYLVEMAHLWFDIRGNRADIEQVPS